MKVIPETCYPVWHVWYQLTSTDDWTGAPKYKDFNLFTYEFGEVWENQGVDDGNLCISLFKQRLKLVNIQNWTPNISQSSERYFFFQINDWICINEIIHKSPFNLRYGILSIMCICWVNKLTIEQGRRDYRPRGNRLCQNYNLHQYFRRWVPFSPCSAYIRVTIAITGLCQSYYGYVYKLI